MAEAIARTTFQLNITEREMRLIALALAGKLKEEKDRIDAAKVNVQIADVLARVAQQRAEILQNGLVAAKAYAEKLGASDDPETD